MNLLICVAVLLLNWPSARVLGQEGKLGPDDRQRSKKSSSGKDTVVVNTPLGRIIGMREGKANAYLGVPFAEPPTGEWYFSS